MAMTMAMAVAMTMVMAIAVDMSTAMVAPSAEVAYPDLHHEEADTRVPLAQRRASAVQIHKSFRSGCVRCLGVFVFRLLQTFVTFLDDYFAEPFQAVLRGVAVTLAYASSVAGCERRHLWTRRILTTKNNTAANYSARSL